MPQARCPDLAQGARGTARPPWRVLLPLAGAVLLAHALVLGTSPSHLGLDPAPAPPAVPALMTRSIALAPPEPAPTPATPTAKAAPEPAPRNKRAAAAPSQAPQEAEEDSVPDMAVTDVSIEPPQTPETNPALMPAQTSAEAPATVSRQARAAMPPASAPATPAAPAPADPATSPASPAAPPAPPAAPDQTPVTAMTLPASARLTYQSTASYKGLTYHASSELLWRHSGTSYDLRLTVSALLRSRTMASQGRISAQGLAPSRFSDKSRSEVAAHFEPDKGQVSFSANTPAMPWVEGGQDRASILIQLGGMLAGNPAAFPAGTRISLYTVGPRDAQTWTFRVEGEETLRLPLGELATVKLSRQLRHEHDQKLEVWYAPALGYLPVRNKLSESRGDFVDQQLSAVDRP